MRISCILLAIAATGISACKDSWGKRQYCSNLGQKMSNTAAAGIAAIDEEITYNWNYCQATDQCLMQTDYSQRKTVDGKLEIFESWWIIDMMTNERLLSNFSSNILGNERKAFEDARQRMFPGCFHGPEIVVFKQALVNDGSVK